MVYGKMIQNGAVEDGEIVEDECEKVLLGWVSFFEKFKVGCLRSPDNVMVSLIQELTEDKILNFREEAVDGRA